MDTVFRAIRKLLPQLPYLSLAIALLYIAGRQYNMSYWKGMGLPLMISSQSVADTVADGFVAWAMLVFSWLPFRVDPFWLILGVASVGAGLFFLVETLTRRGQQRRAEGHRFPPRTKASPAVDAVGEAIIRIIEIFPGFAFPPVLVLFTFFGGLALVISPMKSIDALARKQSSVEATKYKASFTKLRDGLVDVSVARYRAAGDNTDALGIPMACTADRCAIMTTSGPVSLSKDKVTEEYLQAANLTSACYSEAGILSRRT
ncbi:hypothetical protein FIV34_17740 [Luteibacter pinisoli]|uniref:Uncharacterized protein n=1 Tax=Luteibacter pinisoli TaxID=2589080 RepID=A0A4Y5Z9R4_9GAMM|nr:hypothetical protein [Luteibacter pinisoli]QDE40923.1 hypothetical protein FIV34_17740 [Luteibacter pinisoli]